MKVIVKKGTIKIVIAIISIIALVTIGIIVANSIKTNNQIKQTEEKLSDIDTKELETKLVAELKKTKIYLGTTGEDMLIGTEFENIDGFITAKITILEEYNENTNRVEIPCFKLESDSNNKFKSINYFTYTKGIEKIIQETIENVFKKEYNVDLFLKDNNSYNKHFRKEGQLKKIEYNDKDAFETVYKLITNEDVTRNSMYSSIIFGL